MEIGRVKEQLLKIDSFVEGYRQAMNWIITELDKEEKANDPVKESDGDSPRTPS